MKQGDLEICVKASLLTQHDLLQRSMMNQVLGSLSGLLDGLDFSR